LAQSRHELVHCTCLLLGLQQTRPFARVRTPRQVAAAPLVRIKLDDVKLAASLPAGAAAIYTGHIKPSHIVRKVILRQIAIVNDVNPF
jgi:hypothetical protein